MSLPYRVFYSKTWRFFWTLIGLFQIYFVYQASSDLRSFSLGLISSPFVLIILWYLILFLKIKYERYLSFLTHNFIIYLSLGLFFGAVCGINFLINFNRDGNDLTSDFISNTLLYFFPFGCVFVLLWILNQKFRINFVDVFIAAGIVGFLIEQDFLGFEIIKSLDFAALWLYLVNVFPAYGASFSLVWIFKARTDENPYDLKKSWLNILIISISVFTVLICSFLFQQKFLEEVFNIAIRGA